MRLKAFLFFLLLSTTALFAQSEFEVRGTICDSESPAQPLPGAAILIKGTSTGVIADAQGVYSIKVPSKDAVLVCSMIGFEDQIINVAGRAKIDVKMNISSILLEEVVAIGYGTMKKTDITGSVASVDSELLENKPIASFDNALRGQIAGVVVNQSDGQPGGGSSIRIRGTSSINGTNEPLYVIDGVPLISESVTHGHGMQINPLASISNNDIESIEVLKDASATAIYGARGANGVILVTTKKGKEGKGELSFSAVGSVQLPEQTYKLLNGQQLATIGKEAYENAGMVVPDYFQNPESVETKTNWVDEIMRPAFTQNYSLNFNGGSQKIKYNLSAGFFDQQGIIIGTDFKRYNLRAHVAADINKYFSAGTNIAYTQSKSTGYGNNDSSLAVLSMAYDMNPALPVRDDKGEFTFRNNLSSSNGVMGGNPVATAERADMEHTQNRVTGNMYADIKFLGNDKLIFKSQIGIDDIYSMDRLYLPNGLAVAVDGPGKGLVANFKTKTWVLENTLTYNDTWAEKHHFNAMIGQTAQKFTQTAFRLGVKNFEDNRLGYHDMSLGKDVWLTQTTDLDWSMLSYIARIHYSYDERYLFTFTGRVDGSSKFGKNNKYGFFPSGAFAWRVSEEDFMKSAPSISNLKLRLSYGVVGNAGIDPYMSQGTLVSVAPPFGSGVSNSGLGPMTLPNADLAWESTSQFDVGVDFGMFDSRLSITADFYKKYTKDLLYSVDLPMYSGYLFSMRNLGNLTNTGWELAIQGVPFDSNKFSWTTTFNISSNVTKITKLNVAEGETVGTGATRLVVGGKLGDIYGYKTNGIAQIGEDLTQVAQFANRPLVAGEQKYQDVNDDGKIDFQDETKLGNLNPDVTFGWNNTFVIRNFNINLFLEGACGNQIINFTRKNLETLDGARNNITSVLDRWTPSNPNGKMPRADVLSNSNAFSDRWVENGSYLRIKDLTFGYTIPRKAFRNFMKINIFLSFENLYTFTKYSGNDPSIGGGIDMSLYPTSRKGSLGVTITF